MLRVPHSTELPHPIEAVLAQYVDLEHIETVHPASVGRYELLDEEPHRLVYVQHWPSFLGWRARSTVEQIHTPPHRMDFRFLSGLMRGVRVLTTLHALDDACTRVDEVYELPWLPDWPFLRRWVSAWVRRDVARIWAEDLALGLPRGGWPGLADLPEPPLHVLAPGERRCPHADGPLRRCADGTWHCPWHGARYDADGRRLEGPGPDTWSGEQA